MSYSYVAYIDESGDPGCTGPFRTKSTEGGQSNFLTLATYIVRAEHDGDLIQIRDDIRNEVKPRARKRHLHFQNLKHEQKLRYCQLLAQHRARLIAVIFNKAHLDKRAAFSKNSKQLYWYACRLLVERISWLCDDARTGPDNRRVKLFFSDRGGTPCSEFKEYLETCGAFQHKLDGNASTKTWLKAGHIRNGLDFSSRMRLLARFLGGLSHNNSGIQSPVMGKH